MLVSQPYWRIVMILIPVFPGVLSRLPHSSSRYHASSRPGVVASCLKWVGGCVATPSRPSRVDLARVVPAPVAMRPLQVLPFDSPELFTLLLGKVNHKLAQLEPQAESLPQDEDSFAANLIEQHCLYLLACQSSEVGRIWTKDVSRQDWLNRVCVQLDAKTNVHPLSAGMVKRYELAKGDIKSALIGVVETCYGEMVRNDPDRLMPSPSVRASFSDHRAYRDLLVAVAYSAADGLSRLLYQRGLPSVIPVKINGARLDLPL